MVAPNAGVAMSSATVRRVIANRRDLAPRGLDDRRVARVFRRTPERDPRDLHREASRRRGAFGEVTAFLSALGRFLNDHAAFAPLVLYFSWVPFLLYQGWVPAGPFGDGVFGWFAWLFSFLRHLFPYFSDFILASTFWVLVAPTAALVAASLYANRVELRFLVAVFARRLARVRPATIRRASRRAARELVAFPAALAESLGRALLPGGRIHDAISVATEEIVSYPNAVVSAAAASARDIAARLARLDAAGMVADAVSEVRDFPALVAAAAKPYVENLAPLGTVLAELFIGPAPLKGHGVPDLAAFVRAAAGGAEDFEDAFDDAVRRRARDVPIFDLDAEEAFASRGGRLERVDEGDEEWGDDDDEEDEGERGKARDAASGARRPPARDAASGARRPPARDAASGARRPPARDAESGARRHQATSR